jgi:hypothetical protein
MGRYLLKNKKREAEQLVSQPLASRFFCVPLPVHRQKKRVASNWIYAVSATRCICILALHFSKSQGQNFLLVAMEPRAKGHRGRNFENGSGDLGQL